MSERRVCWTNKDRKIAEDIKKRLLACNGTRIRARKDLVAGEVLLKGGFEDYENVGFHAQKRRLTEPKKSGATALKGGKRQQYFTAVRAGMDENRGSIVDKVSGQSQ